MVSKLPKVVKIVKKIRLFQKSSVHKHIAKELLKDGAMSFVPIGASPNEIWRRLKVWWHGAHSFTFIYCTFIHRHSPKFLSISSSLVSSVGKTSLWCQSENRTRACLLQADALQTELRRTLQTDLRRTLEGIGWVGTEEAGGILDAVHVLG